MKAYSHKWLISVLMVAISLMLILPCFCVAEEPDEPEPEVCPLSSLVFLDVNEPEPELYWVFLTGDANEPEPEVY